MPRRGAAMDLGVALAVRGVAGIPATLALTMPATTAGEFRFLRGCLIASGGLIICSLLMVSWNDEWGSPQMRIFINAALAALVVGGITYGLDWLKTKQGIVI